MHLERVISILESVAMAGRPCTVNDICTATGYPKPSVYRLAQDLLTAGLLDSPEKGSFRIGARLHRISGMDRSDAEIGVLVEPLLADFAENHGVACFLARLRSEGVEITQVEVPRSKKVSFLHPGLGLRPMHACSCAKVIAAFGSETFQKEVIDGQLRRYTEHTQTDAQNLSDEFQEIRGRGYGECVQELEVGICSVAAPVQLEDTGIGLSVGATGSMRVFTEKFRENIGQALIELAHKVEDRLAIPAS